MVVALRGNADGALGDAAEENQGKSERSRRTENHLGMVRGVRRKWKMENGKWKNFGVLMRIEN
jgi:hypothetical protein